MELPGRYSSLHILRLAVASRAPGNCELFASLEDGTILHRWYWAKAAAWSDWAEFDRASDVSLLAASSVGPDHLEVFSADRTNIIHRWHREPAGWSDWTPLPTPEWDIGIADISAANNRSGKQYLTVSLDDGNIFLSTYSRREDVWSPWVQLAHGKSSPHAATWASDWVTEKVAGVEICYENYDGTSWCTGVSHGDDFNGFDHFDTIVVQPMPSPWDAKKIVDLAAISRGWPPRNINSFAILENGSLLHSGDGHGWNLLCFIPELSPTSRNSSQEYQKTELLQAPKKTLPLPPAT